MLLPVCQSLEKLVIDAELCDATRILAPGVRLGDGAHAPELLGDIAGPEAFLISDAALRRSEEEARRPAPIADRERREHWRERGGHTTEERARARVEEILRTHEPDPAPADLRRAAARDPIDRRHSRARASPPRRRSSRSTRAASTSRHPAATSPWSTAASSARAIRRRSIASST